MISGYSRNSGHNEDSDPVFIVLPSHLKITVVCKEESSCGLLGLGVQSLYLGQTQRLRQNKIK